MTIVDRLSLVCGQEAIAAEPGAVVRLARAAAGSMRDALSLLDQALAFGAGGLRNADVAEMLGSLDRARLTELLDALAIADAPAMLAQVRALDELAPDYGDVLAGLATLLQQVAVVQVAGSGALDTESNAEEDAAFVLRLAERMAPETVQLMYQIAVMGRRDLVLAPDPRTGFEMALLRMVAFHPDRQRPELPRTVRAASETGSVSEPSYPVVASTPVSAGEIGDWPAFVGTLKVDGAARQLAAHCALAVQSPFELRLTLEKRNGHLLTDNLRGRLTTAVQERLGAAVKVFYSVAEGAQETPAGRQARTDDDELREARERIAADSNLRQMTELFGAEVSPDSIRKNPKSSPRK